MILYIIISLLLVPSNSFPSLPTRHLLPIRLLPSSVAFCCSSSQVQGFCGTSQKKLRPIFTSISDDDHSLKSTGGQEATTPDNQVTSTDDETKSTSRKGSAMAAGIFGVSKAILGTGVLALPGGLAAMSDYPSMLWPANLLMLAMTVLSGYTFSLYGRLAFLTSSKTLDALWSNVFGKKDKSSANDDDATTTSALPISVSNFAFCYGCCLSFLLVIADSLTSLSQLAWPGNNYWWTSRRSVILSVTSTCLWPLCNLKSLQALAPVSIVGVLGALFSTAFVVFRCPAVVKSSPYAATAGTVGHFYTYNLVKGPAPLILFSMGCIALMAHFSATEFLDSFQPKNKDPSKAVDASVDRSPIRQYNIMTVVAYTIVGLINNITLTCGFLTFGGKSAGIVLNNYAASDIGAAISRFLTAVSVGASFPILLSACRSSAFDLFKISREKRKQLTAILLASITALALAVTDAGFVISFTGALMGTAIVYIFPTLMFLRWTKGEDQPIRRLERTFCRFLVGFGGIAAVFGVATSVMNTYFPHFLMM